VRRTFEFDIRSRRYIAPRHSVRSLAFAVETLAMKLRVDRIRAKDADRPLISLVIFTTAQRTRSMARRERKRFVIKEQRRPATGHPLWRDPPFELERASNPTFGGPGTNDLVPAMNTTAVAQPITA
jgi:hypothetical protein